MKVLPKEELACIEAYAKSDKHLFGDSELDMFKEAWFRSKEYYTKALLSAVPAKELRFKEKLKKLFSIFTS